MRTVLLTVAALGIIGGILAAPAVARPYANCTEAHEDGVYDIPQTDPAYWPGGDRDGDGVACES